MLPDRIPGPCCIAVAGSGMAGQGLGMVVVPRNEGERCGGEDRRLNRVGVAVVRLTDGDLRLGDRVKINGRTTELTQTVESLQIEHRGVEHASRGTEVAMKVPEPVRRHDQVFRVRDG
jgi:hypothetical protein